MSADGSIVAEQRTYSDRAHTHDHDFAQLILPLQGALFIETAVHQFELNQTCLFFLPPNCQHTFFAKNHNEFLVLDIPNYLLAGHQAAQIRDGVRSILDDRWQAIRFLLLSELHHASGDHASFNDLFHYAYRLLVQDYLPRSLQYIHAHYDQALEVQQLAELEGYNQTYYCEWFKKLTGQTPKAYIQTIRLERAKELLANTDRPIFQIAQQVGYDHHASLTRLFQHLENVTPAAYRQQCRMLAKQNPKRG